MILINLYTPLEVIYFILLLHKNGEESVSSSNDARFTTHTNYNRDFSGNSIAGPKTGQFRGVTDAAPGAIHLSVASALAAIFIIIVTNFEL